MPAPVIVQEHADSSASSLNGNPATIDFPLPVTPGNMLVFVFHTTSQSGLPAPPADWTERAFGDDAGRSSVVYTRPVVTGDGQIYAMGTTNLTTATSELHGYEVANLDPAALVNASSIGLSGTFTQTNPGPITTTYAECFIVAMAGLGATSDGGELVSDGFSDPKPYSLFHTRTVVAHRITSSIVTGLNPLISWTTSRRAIALQVAFKGLPTTTPTEPVSPPPPGAVYHVMMMKDGVLVPHEMQP